MLNGPRSARSAIGHGGLAGWRGLAGPAAAVGFDVNPFLNVAGEYYASFGPLTDFSPIESQQHQLFGCLNLNFGPAWESNLGFGEGFTRATDHLITKMILGRRVGL